MEKIENGVIQFQGYRITDCRYRCADDYVFPDASEVQYRFGLEKSVDRPEKGLLIVKLRTKVFVGENEETALRFASVELVGNFKSNMDISPVWETNALAILFPYARSIISGITAQSGFPPVILPTVNIAKMFKEAEKKDQ